MCIRDRVGRRRPRPVSGRSRGAYGRRDRPGCRDGALVTPSRTGQAGRGLRRWVLPPRLQRDVGGASRKVSIGRLRSILPTTAAKSSEGHLVVGGCDVVDLVEEFGTPLMVMDRTTIESNAAKVISEVEDATRVFYAGKSFLCVAMCQLIAGLGMGMDVCTGGELETALRAGFPGDRIVFHGNNKSADELELSLIHIS